MKIVIYRRLSKQKAGEQQYGFDSQQSDIDNFLRTLPVYEVIGEFGEFYTGKGSWKQRQELCKAVELCKQEKATLLVSKVDRLGRDVESVSHLLNNIDVRVATHPTADRLTLHILSTIAEAEARAISERTKSALAEAKKRGVKLGGHRTRHQEATRHQIREISERNEKYRKLLEVGREKGLSFRQLAYNLNSIGVKSPKGCDLTAATVQRMVLSLGLC